MIAAALRDWWALERARRAVYRLEASRSHPVTIELARVHVSRLEIARALRERDRVPNRMVSGWDGDRGRPRGRSVPSRAGTDLAGPRSLFDPPELGE